MNKEKLDCLNETHKHVNEVRNNLNMFIKDIIERGQIHDASKFEEPELSVFAANTPKLAQTEYGSPEYQALLKEVQPAIDNHYAKNRHHPEHWANGIDDMTLVDLLEMIADWRAATKRNKNGNIRKSIEVNTDRYQISPQLRKILENTVREYFTE
jgi:hypothetical protein